VSDVERAVQWIGENRNEVGNLLRTVNRATKRFRVRQDDVLRQLMEVR